MLCLDIHRDFREVQVCSDAYCSSNTGGIKYFPDHPHGEFMGSKGVGAQIAGDIHEYFVNGIYVDVLLADILQVDGENLCADLLIELHPRRRDDIGKLQGGIRLQRLCIKGGGREVVLSGFWILRKKPQLPGFAKPLRIYFLYPLNHFKEPCAAGDPMCFQRRGNSEADCLFRARRICHNEICGKRVIFPVCQFHTGIK